MYVTTMQRSLKGLGDLESPATLVQSPPFGLTYVAEPSRSTFLKSLDKLVVESVTTRKDVSEDAVVVKYAPVASNAAPGGKASALADMNLRVSGGQVALLGVASIKGDSCFIMFTSAPQAVAEVSTAVKPNGMAPLAIVAGPQPVVQLAESIAARPAIFASYSVDSTTGLRAVATGDQQKVLSGLNEVAYFSSSGEAPFLFNMGQIFVQSLQSPKDSKAQFDTALGFVKDALAKGYAVVVDSAPVVSVSFFNNPNDLAWFVGTSTSSDQTSRKALLSGPSDLISKAAALSKSNAVTPPGSESQSCPVGMDTIIRADGSVTCGDGGAKPQEKKDDNTVLYVAAGAVAVGVAVWYLSRKR